MEPPAITLDSLAAQSGAWGRRPPLFHEGDRRERDCAVKNDEEMGVAAVTNKEPDGPECPSCESKVVANRSAVWLRDVITRWEGPLVRYATRVAHDLDLGRDAVQETFLRLCRLSDDERSKVESHLARWLFTVCRSRALDAKRKESRMSVVLELDERLASDAMLPDELLEQRETEDHAIALLDRLPDNQQEVIRLKFQNDLSYREIADITGHSISNVGFLLHTGIKRLREMMKGDEEP